MPRSSSMATPLQHLQRDVHDERQHQQHQAERDRQAEVALRGVQRDGRGQRTGRPADVAADNHRRANFGDDLTERRGYHGGEREARLARYRPRGPPRSRPQRLGRAADALVDALNCGGRQRRGDRQREQYGADDDRLPGIEPADAAQRAAAGEQAVQQQADDDGRESERGIDYRQRRAPPPERPSREEITQRQPGGAGDGGRYDRDFESEKGDPINLGITGDEESPRPPEALG